MILQLYQAFGGTTAGILIFLGEYNLLTIFGICSVLFLCSYTLFGGEK